MSKGNEPAYPVTRNQLDQVESLRKNTAIYRDITSGGLTKRELFAAMAMQGLCALEMPAHERAAYAVEHADDLLAELERSA